MDRDNLKEPILVWGKEPIFHLIIDREALGISKECADLQDLADEYAVVVDEDANAGLITYAKYNGTWRPNPWSTRFLVRALLIKTGIVLPPLRK